MIEVLKNTLSDLIPVMQFFPHRTDADERITEGYLVITWLVMYTSDKMDFIFYTIFNFT